MDRADAFRQLRCYRRNLMWTLLTKSCCSQHTALVCI